MRRIALALAMPEGTLSRTAFSALVADAWAAQDVAGRYLLARRLLPVLAERDVVNAPTREMLAEPLGRVLDFERDATHRMQLTRAEVTRYNALLAVLAKLDVTDERQHALHAFAVEQASFDAKEVIARDAQFARWFGQSPKKTADVPTRPGLRANAPRPKERATMPKPSARRRSFRHREDGVMRELALSALPNMPAPPRSTVDVRPLRATGKPRGRWASGLGDAGSHGRAGTKGRMPSGEFEPHELVEAVAMLRTGGEHGPRFEAERLAVRKLSPSALHDEFLGRVAALGAMDLPLLLLTRSVPHDGAVPVQRPIEPLVALRLLTGTAGGLFLRTRAPSVGLFLFGTLGSSLSANHTSFYYYLPSGAARRRPPSMPFTTPSAGRLASGAPRAIEGAS